MTIDLANESKQIVLALKNVDGYLNCEKLIIHHIKKLLGNGFTISVIEVYLAKLMRFFDDLVGKNKGNMVCVNYSYVSAFVKTLVTTPFWHSWIKLPDL